MRWICLVAVLAAAPRAHAHPASYIAVGDGEAEPPPTDWRATPAWFEWSSWVGVGLGARSAATTSVARTSTTAPHYEHDLAWAFHAGVDVTLPITHAVRGGAWLGLEGLEPMAGMELSVTRAPADLDMFFYTGEGVWTVRAGGGETHATAAVGWGYRCPWKLWGPYSRATRYEIGARLMLVATRAYTDPHDWTATLGVEVEPVGALRYLLGIRSWY